MSKKHHERHPTISFRYRSIDENNKIKDKVKISGKSESDFIRESVLVAVEKESNSYFTIYAKHLAERCNIELWDRNVIKDKIKTLM